MTATTQEEEAASDPVIPQKIRPGGDGLASPLIPLLLLLIAFSVIGSALFGGPVRDTIESRQEGNPGNTSTWRRSAMSALFWQTGPRRP